MNSEAIKVAALTGLAAAIFTAGWLVEGWRMGARMADLKASYQATESRATQQAIGRMVEANRRAEALQARLAAEEAARQKLHQESNDAIRRLTVGRPCLDSAAVRVLNRAAGLKPAAMPAATSQPVSADATFATDTDVGLWAGQCWRSYDTCRGRIEALGEFFKDNP